MEVEVSLYGNLAHLAGARVRTIRVEGASPTVSDLRAAIARQLPELASGLRHTAVGIGTELLSDDSPLEPGARVSLLPPVSGG